MKRCDLEENLRWVPASLTGPDVVRDTDVHLGEIYPAMAGLEGRIKKEP